MSLLSTMCTVIANQAYAGYNALPTGYTFYAQRNGNFYSTLTPGAASKVGPGSNGLPSVAFTSQANAEAVDKHGMPEFSQPDNTSYPVAAAKITNLPSQGNSSSSFIMAKLPSGGAYANAAAFAAALLAAAVDPQPGSALVASGVSGSI